ncbi:MAG: hypothetical protein LBE34_14370 [Flavobacteriaceae bacterium]|jgi:hypothetical protein|nr:hypothetical protein [Flavobacteriaceae bacterium]
MGTRFLMTQNENNNGTNHIVVDGVLIESEFDKKKVVEKLFKGQSFKRILDKDSLKIGIQGNQIFIDSFYETKDTGGRRIFYMYLINQQEIDFDGIVDLLEIDSKILSREISAEMLDSIRNLQHRKSVKKRINLLIAGIIGVALLVYLISKVR